MKVREIPQQAIEFVGREEGCVLYIYKDVAGYPTIGIGHLVRKGEDFSKGITKEEAENILKKDLLYTAASIMRLITVQLSDQQYVALLSFTFNVGTGALQASTLRSKLNREEYASAAEEFQKWCWAGGKKLKALYNRRIRERNLFMSGELNEENDI